MSRETKMAASGKWGGLLVAVGLDETILNGKHQACPLCGGKDRFRFTNVNDGGEYFCSGCGPGDGFNLIAGIKGYGFKEAAKEVDRLLGNGDIKEVFQPKVDYERRRADLNRVWAGATAPNVALTYLGGRGINVEQLPADIRGHPALYNADTGERQIGMCALIRNSQGVPISIHRTFFNPKAKKIMPPTEKIVGAGVRLGCETDRHLVIGEGIETTLMGTNIYRCSGLAALSAHGMESLVVPDCDRVTILADNDKSFTGQKAAFALAHRLRDTRDVNVLMASEPGYDFLDYSIHGYADLLEWSNES